MAISLEPDSLNSARYLYLRELSEPQDNALRLVVQEAIIKCRRFGSPSSGAS